MSQEQPAQPPSTWSKTKGGFQTVGKGASATRKGINNGMSKLDNMSISSKGVSFKKQLSGQNVSYDRDNHVSAPKVDVSHFAPPPKRIPGQVPSPQPTTQRAPVAPAKPARPLPSSGSGNPSPPIPSSTRPGRDTPVARAVPAPPPRRETPSEEPLPVYTAEPVGSKASIMGDLSSRMGQMRAASGPTAPKPVKSTQSSIPSRDEATTAFQSAKTVGGLYGKYGNQQPGQKTATPTWQEVKAGASAAQNLHSFHGKYAPKQPVAVPQSSSSAVPQPIVAPKPMKSVPSTYGRATVAAPSPKPPLPAGKPSFGPPKEFCIGLYSFDAQTSGDLSFAVGDKIEVLERTSDPDAWWKGKLNGVEGIFPGNYCRLEKS
ncbi:protein of unknown function [Taphrina deformans PYCC 5710]|uniref:SH3 domain-containing protein n=1 Tax=Taphrina deformans (strain PYCC 5710 / ATCC 11124 / CBS 356.35 / IMI 108563 / JCM 9778 / NBRC 8474) TaxID=1097556 RepID=R4XDS1_TAPDE|nr:protein of unknown function [Taphrina deformans PYCC 5710]|eukprot:CCG83980.1 protein of unknown function [Taphrina deformans PYCC 5710]